VSSAKFLFSTRFIGASVPDWATGAKISRPRAFRQQGRRQFWFDFYPIVTFTTLYVQGIAKPCSCQVRRHRPERRPRPLRTEPRQLLDLSTG